MTRLEERRHLRDGAPAAVNHDPEPEEHNADAEGRRLLRRTLPPRAHLGAWQTPQAKQAKDHETLSA